MSVQVEALADEVFAAATAQIRPGALSQRRPFGEIITNPMFPDVVFLHRVHDLVAPDWDPDQLEAVIDAAIPYAPSYRADTRDPATRDGLGARLLAAGYEARHDAGMAQLFDSELAANPNIHVEPVTDGATWQDFEQLVRSDWSKAHASTVTQVLAFYRWSRENAPQRWFVGYDGARPVAHVGLHQHRSTAYLHALFTMPEARAQGIGSTLVSRMAEEARAAGCQHLTLLCVLDSLLPAYHHRLGFRTVGERYAWTKPRPARRLT